MSQRKTPDPRLRDIGILQPTCTATTRAGNGCKKKAVTGSNVCASHGGAAPQVREAGLRRVRDEVAARLSKAWLVVDAALDEEIASGGHALAWKLISAQAGIEAASEPREEIVLEQVTGWTSFEESPRP